MTKTTINSFTDLYAWQEGHKLALATYSLTKSFPKEELFGLTMQMRRSAVSVTSNIAEGFSRQSYKEKIQFYAIALGSVTELQSQLLIAKDVGFVSGEIVADLNLLSISVHKMINGLIKKSRSFVA